MKTPIMQNNKSKIVRILLVLLVGVSVYWFNNYRTTTTENRDDVVNTAIPAEEVESN